MAGRIPRRRLAALHHRDFRLLWLGQLISATGSQMQIVAINWQIYVLLKGSSVTTQILGQPVILDAKALGLATLGLVRVVPIIAFALFGGLIADSQDRRRVMLWTQTLLAIFAAILGIITLSGVASIGAIYLLTAAGAAITAFGNPAQQSLVPHLVPRENLTNAISLNTLLMQITSIVGPSLACALPTARASSGARCCLTSS